MGHSKTFGWLAIAVLGLVCLPLTSTLAQEGQASTSSAKASAADASASTEPGQSEYVGAETCKTCHEDMFKNFENTPHFVTTLENKRGPEWHGCEACHGPGKGTWRAAATRPKFLPSRTPRRKSPARAAWAATATAKSTATSRGRRTCRTTWAASTVTRRIMPKNANFDERKAAAALLRMPSGSQTAVQSALSSSGERRHGAVQRLPQSARRVPDPAVAGYGRQDTVCFKCHSEKAGPFVYEHQAVKTEGCVSCHTPHGSANPRLLKRSQVNLVCLECHSLHGRCRRSGHPDVPQPGAEISGMHVVSRGHSWVELRPFFFK